MVHLHAMPPRRVAACPRRVTSMRRREDADPVGNSTAPHTRTAPRQRHTARWTEAAAATSRGTRAGAAAARAADDPAPAPPRRNSAAPSRITCSVNQLRELVGDIVRDIFPSADTQAPSGTSIAAIGAPPPASARPDDLGADAGAPPLLLGLTDDSASAAMAPPSALERTTVTGFPSSSAGGPPHAGGLGLGHLRHAATVLILTQAALAPSTSQVYDAPWRRLRTFLHRPPSAPLFPVTTAAVADFVGSRFAVGCGASTLASHCSAIASGHRTRAGPPHH